MRSTTVGTIDHASDEDAKVETRARRVLITDDEPITRMLVKIAHIRREPTLAAMPIVALTSEDGPGVEQRVLDLGADDYVIKPFDAKVLLSRVNAVFGRLSAVAA